MGDREDRLGSAQVGFLDGFPSDVEGDEFKIGEHMAEKKEWTRRTQTIALSLHRGDKELLAWAAEFLGTSQADVARSAIRAYVMHLEAINRKGKPGRKP